MGYLAPANLQIAKFHAVLEREKKISKNILEQGFSDTLSGIKFCGVKYLEKWPFWEENFFLLRCVTGYQRISAYADLKNVIMPL